MRAWPKFSERVRIRGGGLNLTLAAEVLRSGSGSVSADELVDSAGGQVTFLIRDSAAVSDFRDKPAGKQVEFTRWRRGILYAAKSAEPEGDGRLLRVTAERKN